MTTLVPSLTAGAPTPPATSSARPLRRHDGALFAWLLAGYPVAWFLGLGLFHHLVLAAAMVAWLTANRPLRLAKGTGTLALFLVVALFSGIGIHSAGTLALFGLRLSWYLAALICWVYLARHRGPSDGRRVVRAFVVLWIFVVAGGWLSILAPEAGWSTPLIRALPPGLADNDLIGRFLQPQVSEVQVFRYQDVVLHRPAAPFPYTNGWGSAMAMLTPFAIAAIHDRRVGFSRPVMFALLAAALVPFTVALNRGSWLTLGLGLVYGAVRLGRRNRDPRPLMLLGLLVVVGLAVASMSGATRSATDALATRSADSNDTRAALYLETLTEVAKSPLIGYGSTKPSIANPSGPPLGTHGQLWAVVFAHGYLGAALYVGFFVAAFARARSTDPVQHWAKVALLIGLLQLPIYGHLPHQLFIMVGAAAVALWPSDRSVARP